MKNSSLWNEILNSLTNVISQEEVDKWLKPMEIGSLKSGLVTLIAPNKFYKSWVEENYIKILKRVLKEEFAIKKESGDNSLEPDVEVTLKKAEKASGQASKQEPKITAQTEDKQKKDIYSLPISKEYTFDNFVVGTSNRYAHAACIAASKGFNNLYNPLYIYGDVGLGKTHLMLAVGNELRVNFPKLKVIYATGESFMNEYIWAMRNKDTIDDFKEKYSNIDVLLFDDVQTITKGPKTQEEFFFTYNMLFSKEKRIILTSNAAPLEIPELDKKLSSRFSSGLMVDIQPPSVDEKVAIISKRFDMMSVKVTPDIIHFLAENLKTTSVRDMIGMLIRLSTLAEVERADITIDFCNRILKEFLIKRDRVLSPDRIIDIVASFFQLKPVDLKSKKRSNAIVLPRSIAMYLLREKTQLSLMEVGSRFDRDHSTVMTAVKRIADAEKSDQTVKSTLEDLRRKMKLDTNN